MVDVQHAATFIKVELLQPVRLSVTITEIVPPVIGPMEKLVQSTANELPLPPTYDPPVTLQLYE